MRGETTLACCFADFPLRDRKRAQTRVALVRALLPRLAKRQLKAIAVAELCDEAGISQGTFFNYFPSKADLLTHYVQLWSLQMGLVAIEAEREHASPLAAIEALYAATAQEISAYPRVMMEIIAHQARLPRDCQLEPVELVERLLFLDDASQAADLDDSGLEALLPSWLGQAVAMGLLPPATDVAQLTLAAASVFFGVPLLLGHDQPALIEPLYRQQLALLWEGARATWGTPG